MRSQDEQILSIFGGNLTIQQAQRYLKRRGLDIEVVNDDIGRDRLIFTNGKISKSELDNYMRSLN